MPSTNGLKRRERSVCKEDLERMELMASLEFVADLDVWVTWD